MGKLNGLKEKAVSGLNGLKGHWKTPPEGYYVCYKEFLNMAVGSGSISFIGVIITWTSIAISTPMMLSYFKVSSGFIFVAGLVGSLIGLLRSPILSMIIDNSNSPKGKFKPFLVPSTILTTVFYSIIPFIPESWIENILFSFNIPALPILNVEASAIDVSLGALVMFILLQIGAFFHTLLSQCLVGLEQVISPVSQERANIIAIKGLVSNLPSSVVNIIIPLVAGIIFASSANPMGNIQLYRWALPACGIGGLIFVLFAYYGVKERTVVHKEFVAKVKFIDGAKQLFTNKYFWLLTFFGLVTGIRGAINFNIWICNYAIGGQEGAFVLTICNIVLNNALVLGMITGPALIKKFGKRNILLLSTICFTFLAFFQLLTIKSPYLILVAIFLQNLFSGFTYISSIMTSDVLDYQQWKTGQRLEGFWQNCSGFILTFIGIFTSILSPLFMSFGGIGFGDNIDVALQNTEIMHSTFSSMTWLGIIGSVLSIIPLIFYDLTEDKHADYIRVLKIRAAVKNFESDKLSNEEKNEIRDIVSYSKESNRAIVLDELDKLTDIDSIISA